jgi:MFS family permease
MSVRKPWLHKGWGWGLLSATEFLSRVIVGQNMEAIIKSGLWTKNFTFIISGTIVSAIGGVGLNLALSVTVYNHTQSTWLMGLYSAITIVPGMLLPVLLSPFVDRYPRKKIIVRQDLFMGVMFLLFAWWTHTRAFDFSFYLLMGLIISINGVIYGLAYNSLFPNLIPEGMFQKGYAIGNLIYPLTNVVALPVATLVFKYFGVASLFLVEGLLLLTAVLFEMRIDITETTEKVVHNPVKNHFLDIQKGFDYLRKEACIGYIYAFFVVMMFSQGITVLIYPFFEQRTHLQVMNYAFLLSFESAGYMFGGFMHYFIKIPTKLRYGISVVVYGFFAVFGGAFFFMPFTVMLITKFILGFIGMNSANIRVTSINHYIDDGMRGRLNAIFQTLVSMASLSGRLLAGYLGELMPYEVIGILYGSLIGIGMLVFIIKKKAIVMPLYNQEL